MSELRSHRFLISVCLLTAVAVPLVYFGIQVVAVPFYPGYSFSLQSVSMLGTQFSREPWIYNLGAMLIGFFAFGAALGLYLVFRTKTSFLLSLLIGISVACTGIVCVIGGMFPMPDPRHSSWNVLQNLTIITPHLMLIGLLRRKENAALRIYLVLSIAFLFVLSPLGSRFERGTLQRLIDLGTIVPVGVVGLFFWRELHKASRRTQFPNSGNESPRDGALEHEAASWNETGGSGHDWGKGAKEKNKKDKGAAFE
jgi:hypothetical membrane protein